MTNIKEKLEGKLKGTDNVVPLKPATQKQLTLIYKLAEKNKLSKENAKEILKDLYKVDSSSQLTLQQADEFIKYLKS